MGDLVQAHGVGQTKTTQYSSNSVQGASEKGLINGFNHRKDHIEDQNVTLESIHKTLCDLLQFGLVSLVHISHFRSDADNRREAEKEVPPPEEYKARSKRDQDAQKEAAIKEKLDQWKYGSQTPQITVETPKNGKKRPLEKEDTSQAEKRRRLHLALSNQYVGVTEEGIYQPKMGESGYLDVRIRNVPWSKTDH